MRVNFVFVRVGKKYSADYVAVLADMVLRNSSELEERAFWCITDKPDELPDGVGYIPADLNFPGWWQKLRLFSPDMPWAEGERVVYLDLDVAIVGRLEDLAETPGIIKDWLWPCLNSSVMVWDHGDHREIWDKFRPELMTLPGRVVPPECLPSDQINGGDQEWITEVDRESDGPPWRLFPRQWCLNYRQHALSWPTGGSKVISFNGALKPHMIEDGWVPHVWKVGGFTALPVMNGVNVTHEHLLENIRANVTRDLQWFGGGPDNSKTAVLVAGGPSMKDCLPQIRDHKRRGARIVTVNNAWRTLTAAGITPDVHVMLDARPENVDFLNGAPSGVRYLLASQCHPSLFDALADQEVCMWHNGFGDCDDIRAILEPYWDGENARPIRLIPGGGTVGLRSLFLIAYSGYKKIHVYGMDSSFHGDEHHAYAQPLNDADPTQVVALRDPETGSIRRYRCAPWMLRQAEEFKWHWRDLEDLGVRLFVHGKGLVPDIAKDMRKRAREAA